MSKTFKPILLAGLATFLYQRLVDGTILFYINRRFVWLIWAAVGALLLIAISYIFHRRAPEHEHEHEHGHGHDHALSWLTASLVALPLLLGWMIAPQPLGMAALVNRELSNVPTFEFAPAANPAQQASTEREETILDWVMAFGPHPDPAAFAGQPVDVTGFVYRRPDLPPDTWLVSRFLVMCCVADATPISLVVYAPGVAIEDDMWVRVRGQFAAETAGQIPTPLLIADEVTPIEPPAQPYLYY